MVRAHPRSEGQERWIGNSWSSLHCRVAVIWNYMPSCWYLNEVAVGVTHVAAPFPAVRIGQWLGKKKRSFAAPLFVAGPDVGDTQIKEAIYSVQMRRCFKKDLWLVGSRATAGIENEPRISQLDVAGIFRLDQFPAENSDRVVPRFFLVAHGEEVSCEEAFVCNRRVR